MTDFDLVVRGGTVVTAASRARCDVGIVGGRVAALAADLRGARELDAGGAYVLPGGVDMHVHLSAVAPSPEDDPRFVDDFLVGSLAALGGGVTTVGQMSFPDDEEQPVADALARDLAAAGEQAVVDYVTHPSLLVATEETLRRLPEWAAAGHMALKVVTLMLDHDARNQVAAIKRAGELGMITLVHCEDDAIIEFHNHELVAAGRDGMQHYPASRPDHTETAAVERAVAICEATGAPMVIVHLSSQAALDATRRARARGLPIWVETRPIYLQLTDAVHAGPEPGRFASMPPVRGAPDRDALWRGIAEGAVHTIGSDHAPWFLRDKVDPARGVPSCLKGMAELETMLPVLFSEGVLSGRISLERFVAVTATNPAMLHGLYPRKGTIAIGSDADLVVMDPGLRRRVDGAHMQSRAGYSPLDGLDVAGWPRHVVRRGTPVWGVDGPTDAAVPGSGQFVVRGRTVAP